MIVTKVDKGLLSTVTVKIVPLCSKIKTNLDQSCSLVTLLQKLLSGDSKVPAYCNSHYTA